ncbi:hypothetical protein [Neobacillus fumarioli]|uniref:UPF0738 family protein n=1 Tax=Neobacillus fumarioli TaxID=105229 RepID=UPI000831FC9A|nr:hypothetical protein [Neobacillus fumarioli]
MKRRIKIIDAKCNENRLFLRVEDDINGLIPAEQILVDSDHFSFIYLMEDQDDYTYIDMPEQIWPQLKTALVKKLPVWIGKDNQEIELCAFTDELEYVLGNIKGNSNYGQEMVEKAESIF